MMPHAVQSLWFAAGDASLGSCSNGADTRLHINTLWMLRVYDALVAAKPNERHAVTTRKPQAQSTGLHEKDCEGKDKRDTISDVHRHCWIAPVKERPFRTTKVQPLRFSPRRCFVTNYVPNNNNIHVGPRHFTWGTQP